MPKFGRIYTPDENDKHYPLRLVLDPLRAVAFPHDVPPGRRSYRSGPILDQGNTGTCVAHGWSAKIAGGPIMQPMPMTPYDFYRLLVKLDEYRENDFEAVAPDALLQYGSSVRGGAKAAQKIGALKSYLWAESVSDVRGWHLVGKGGFVIGVDWKTGMMETDSEGFISYTGNVEGGHCVATVAWDDFRQHRGHTVRAVQIQQSWGLPWGDKGKGFAWIEEGDLAKMITDNGEFCAATEQRIKPLNTTEGVPGPVHEQPMRLNPEDPPNCE